jgi:RHS repeat-associated protein
MATSQKVADGAWHHVVLTRGASTWAMTIDGAAKTLTNNTTSPGTPGAGFSIGALADGTRSFTGEVDEVAAYTADISGSTAVAHWAAGRRSDAVTALTTRNGYDRLGRLVDAWAPDLVRQRATYDRLGNQTETIANYRDGTTTGGTSDDDVRSTYAYDVLGELIGYCPADEVKVGGCDPSSSSEVQAWHYGVDAMGRQTTTIPPVNTAAVALTTEEVVYQPGGRIDKTCRYPAVTSCGSTNSRHTDFTYDNLGRVLTQKTYDRGAGSDTLKFTKTMTWNKDGSADTVNEGSDTLTYVYDNVGRLSQLKRGATVLTAYTYTANTGTIATRTDGTQGAVTFTYDWARRQTVIDPPDTYVAGTVTRSYRLDGLLSTQSFPSSLTETLAYDEAKRPTSISLGVAGSISQAFDRAGRVTSDGRSLSGISGDAGTGTQSFTYDSLSRLTGSSGLAVSRSYQYDLDGNRTQKVEGSTTTAYTYDRADQLATQVISGTTKTYDYDRYGNLLSAWDNASAQTTYAYDGANRLTTIAPPGGAGNQVTFTMDALDRHMTRSVGGSTADNYGYVGDSETAWQVGNATTTGSLLDADGTRLAVKTGSTVSWLLFDLHGSVAAVCPAGSTTLSDAYRYDGFGQQVASAGTVTNPWRYRGLLNLTNDFGMGALLDMGARDYAPQLGVFTQEDSVQGGAANPMTMNRFLYALANPATLIDPDGHMVAGAADEPYYGCPVGGCTAPVGLSTTSGARTATATDGCDACGGEVAPSEGWSCSYTLGCFGPMQPLQTTPLDPEFVAGAKDAAAWTLVAAVLGGACVAATGGVCAPFLLTLGTAYTVKAGVDIYNVHGVHLGPVNVGGNEPWTHYEIANLTVSALALGVGYGMSRLGLARGVSVPDQFKIASQHLASIGKAAEPENAMMLELIEKAIRTGRPLTRGEATFLYHEVIEADLIKAGFGGPVEVAPDVWDFEAHDLAGQFHDQFSNYDPKVIQAFPELFNSSWGAYWEGR